MLSRPLCEGWALEADRQRVQRPGKKRDWAAEELQVASLAGAVGVGVSGEVGLGSGWEEWDLEGRRR